MYYIFIEKHLSMCRSNHLLIFFFSSHFFFTFDLDFFMHNLSLSNRVLYSPYIAFSKDIYLLTFSLRSHKGFTIMQTDANPGLQKWFMFIQCSLVCMNIFELLNEYASTVWLWWGKMLWNEKLITPIFKRLIKLFFATNCNWTM